MANATYHITITAADATEWVEVKAKVDATVSSLGAAASKDYDEGLMVATLDATIDGPVTA
jgi:hypothetical protein